MLLHLPSRVDSFKFDSQKIYIKRDDCIHPLLSGNKFRKLSFLYHTPKEKYSKIISYGGSQSNAMLSIAALCHDKKWEFEYYTKTISSQAKEQQCQSNYSKAIELGMTCIEIEHTKYHERIEALHLNFDASMLTLAQGGANINAEEGIKVLATEIKEWQYFNSIENLKVVTPSGTGTTAYFLAKNLECEVYTIACVGNEMYLKEQISSLGEYPSNLTFLTTQKRYHFAKLYKEFYEIYHDIKKAGEGIDLEIDLLYAPKMFLALKENGIKGDILYIHSGGLIGNESMVQRYEHKKKLARH